MIAMRRECLTGDEIRQALRGELPAAEFDSAISHLDRCESCRESAETLREGETGIADGFVPGVVDELQNETACQVALCKIIQTPKSQVDAFVPSDLSTMPCEKLGPYRLMDALGAGGMGTVYLAEHERLKRKCAIKLLPRERVDQPGWLERFDREMTTIASLQHEHVVCATDAGHESGWHYLVMEHLDGMDVSRIASRVDQLSVEDSCEIARQAALGLAHIHDSGLVHRDIKPSNLMLTRRGTVKILDLGLVLSGDDPLAVDDRLTTVGHVMGTMPYMAPEQLTDSRLVSPLSDIYALGATLYRLIAGRPPHGRKRGLAAQVLAITNTDPARLDTIRDDVDLGVVELVSQMLDRDPARRPQSAVEIASRLSDLGKPSDLKKLVREAARRPNPEVATSLSLFPSVGIQADASTGKAWRHWIFGAVAASLVLLAAMVIKIQTDKGDLIVHSEVDGLTVLIKQGEKVVDRLTIDSTEDNRKVLHKGTYRVEIEGGGTALKLSDEVVTIGRGESEEISISKLAEKQIDRVVDSMNTITSDPKPVPPTAGGEFGAYLDYEYVDILSPLRRSQDAIENETDLDDVGDAMVDAVVFFESAPTGGLHIDDETHRDVTNAILKRARDLGGLKSKIPPPRDSNAFQVSDSEHFMWYFNETFHRLPIKITLAASAKELRDGNGRSRAAALTFLKNAKPETRKPFDSFSVSNVIRGCSALVAVRGNESVWDELPLDQREEASALALETALRFCDMHGMDPMSIPSIEMALKSKRQEDLSDLERRAMKLPPKVDPSAIVSMDLDNDGIKDSVIFEPAGEDPVPNATEPSSTKKSSERVFQGKSLDEWLATMAVEQDPLTLGRIIMAVESLTKDSAARAGAAAETLRLTRRFGGFVTSSPSPNTVGVVTSADPSPVFMHYLRETFRNYFPDPGIEAIATELGENVGNEKSKIASILLLWDYVINDVNLTRSMESWFGISKDDETRRRQCRQMVVDLIRVSGEFSNNSTHQDLLIKNEAAKYARECALKIQLLIGEPVSDHVVLKNHVITEIDKAFERKKVSADNEDNFGFGNASPLQMSEAVLAAAIQMASEPGEGEFSAITSDEHWELYLDRLVNRSAFFANHLILHLGLFDRVKQSHPQKLLDKIEIQVEEVANNPYGMAAVHAFDRSSQNSIWVKALPFVAEATTNPDKVLELLTEIDVNANNNPPPGGFPAPNLIDQVDEAIEILKKRVK